MTEQRPRYQISHEVHIGDRVIPVGTIIYGATEIIHGDEEPRFLEIVGESWKRLNPFAVVKETNPIIVLPVTD